MVLKELEKLLKW